ncbi:MAG TPA: hypothetical protein VFW11_00635 [Cyclobacteriaceae bacterium]|nr:hypothetical protein [Cyclobacteriaceae bacterium]
MKPGFIGLIFLTGVNCCVSESVSKEELSTYVTNDNNGLVKTAEKNNVDIHLVYRPKELVLLQEAEPGTDEWIRAMKNLDSLDYFVLQISKNGHEVENTWVHDDRQFLHAVKYLSDGITNEIEMEIGNNSILPEQTVFSQTFGTAGRTSVLIVFKSYLEKQVGTFKVVWKDSALGVGRVEFTFQTSDIRKVPKLKTANI